MNEAHQRFRDWLTDGADGEPARDVAVHASVCTECRRSIAALDMLAVVNPGMASMPAEPIGRERGQLEIAGRLAGATAILFSAAILGVGVSQLIGVSHANNGPVAQASTTPDQNVLGGTATSQPSEATPTPSPQETLTPLGTPAPTPRPQPVATPTPVRTAPPTPIPTASPPPIPTSSGVPSETPLPSASSSATPPPSDTPAPTPAPSVPGAPTLLSATPGPGVVDLVWSAPASDGGSTITGYEIWRGLTTCTETLYATVGNQFTYQDASAPTGTYFYCVAAKNVVGTGSLSNERSATTV